MTFELGIHSFGNTPRNADGSRGSTAQAICDTFEAIKIAEEVGLELLRHRRAPHARHAEVLSHRHGQRLEYEGLMFEEGMRELGRGAPPRSARASAYERGGMVFVGNPNEVADRILHLHSLLGHSRQIIQLDVGGMPQRDVLRGIELLGTESSPRSAPSSTAHERPALR